MPDRHHPGAWAADLVAAWAAFMVDNPFAAMLRAATSAETVLSKPKRSPRHD